MSNRQQRRIPKYQCDFIAGPAVKIIASGLVLSMLRPNRHHDVLHALAEMTGKALQTGDHIQGFMGRDGQFLNRSDAGRIAGKREALYSEDLW